MVKEYVLVPNNLSRRQLSVEGDTKSDCDASRSILQRGGINRAPGDGGQRGEARYHEPHPRRPQKLREQGKEDADVITGKLYPLFQEYFQSSAYPEGVNGSSYYGQLPPVQQAHSTTPHEAPHSVSVTTGAGPGAGLPPSGPPISLAPAGLAAPAVRDLPIRADVPKSIGS